ncbi:hypothetical protein C2G38_2166643 [Gigaspora rosea]|uniref:Uncharacterized protein n=1 Tax=Gigaspora rosea TaxID=44941 RepID=A0A397VTU5_9GLOM|nr:hypothetical protein C2G38_2166643 [Gigaspora rosea]
MKEEENMYVRNRVKVNEDVNMMIDKNVSNNESKCDSSKSGLENENARKTNIESNESIGEEKELEEINLINFDELDQISEGKLEGIFDVFFESDLIDFRCVEGNSERNDEFGYSNRGIVKCKKLVMNNDIKVEMISEADAKTFEFVEMDNIAKDLLKTLMDNVFTEFGCRVDLSK